MTGDELKQWRQNAAFTLTDLEGMTGVERTAIWRFENGKQILVRNYEKLLAAMQGKEPLPDADIDNRSRIRYHLKQIELLLGLEESK